MKPDTNRLVGIDAAVIAAVSLVLCLAGRNLLFMTLFVPLVICLRIALDFGPLKYADDTGRIVSDVINYAAHLEKSGTPPGALSVSDSIYSRLPKSLKDLFTEKQTFEGRSAYSTGKL